MVRVTSFASRLPSLRKNIATLPAVQKRFFNENSLRRALKDIEMRWVLLPEAERGAIADALEVKQKGDWNKMTADEKRAG